MSFREVQVHEIREVLRLWLRGEGLRSIERLTAVDRKTVRRYVGAAVAGGLARDGGDGQLSDGLIGQVCERVRPHRRDGHGRAWAILGANHDQLCTWLGEEHLTVRKAHELLARRGVVVPERTVHRYALEVLGVARSARATTVRVADGEPGSELQVDFGRMGLVADPVSGRRRVCWALIFTAVYSRHCFVWLTFRQTTEAVIEGFEAAWRFFGGVFAVVIPENVPRNIFVVLCPSALCGRRQGSCCTTGGDRRGWLVGGHITVRARRAKRALPRRPARRGEGGVPPKSPRVRWCGGLRSSPWCWSRRSGSSS
jgi:hypothetical protein